MNVNGLAKDEFDCNYQLSRKSGTSNNNQKPSEW